MIEKSSQFGKGRGLVDGDPTRVGEKAKPTRTGERKERSKIAMKGGTAAQGQRETSIRTPMLVRRWTVRGTVCESSSEGRMDEWMDECAERKKKQ